MSILEYETPHYQPDEGRMRGFSLHQPWASLIAEHQKMYETRGWAPTSHLWLAIHAAKVEDSEFRQSPTVIDALGEDPLPRGAIVAVAWVAQAVPTESIVTKITFTERLFGDFIPWAVGMASSPRVPAHRPHPVPRLSRTLAPPRGDASRDSKEDSMTNAPTA